MTKPIGTNKVLSHQFDDASLAAHLKAMPQAEPSAELDAAIFAHIEQALKQEAHHASNKVTDATITTEYESQVDQSPRRHLFQVLEHKLKQFWFVPVGAMAVLLASVTMNQTPSELHSPTLPTAIPTATSSTTNLPVNEVADKVAPQIQRAESQTRPDQIASEQKDAKPAPQANAAANKVATDSKQMASDLASLIEAKSKTRMAAKELVKRENKEKETPTELAQLNESASKKQVVVEKSDIALQKAISAAPVVSIDEVRAKSAAIASNAAPQHVEVTGSSIKRMTVESSQAVQSLEESKKLDDRTTSKTELYAVKDVYDPNQGVRQDDAKAAKMIPREARAAIEMPKPVMSRVIEEPRPVAPISPVIDTRRGKSDAPIDVISQRLEQLLNAGRDLDALQLWRDFRENYPRSSLTPELQKKIEAIERKHSANKK